MRSREPRQLKLGGCDTISGTGERFYRRPIDPSHESRVDSAYQGRLMRLAYKRDIEAMANENFEQDLVDRFIDTLRSESCEELQLDGKPCNALCRSPKYADIEYKSVSGCTWAIEAKSGKGSNKPNQVYQLFGNLLAATKRGRCKIGLLLSAEGEPYIRKRIKENSLKINFSRLGDGSVNDVFVLDRTGNLCRMTWKRVVEPHRVGWSSTICGYPADGSNRQRCAAIQSIIVRPVREQCLP